MTLEEMRAEYSGLTEKIENAETIDKVKELTARGKELKADIEKAEKEAKDKAEAEARAKAEAEKKEKEATRSKFDPGKALESRRRQGMSTLEQREKFREYMTTRADATTVLTDIKVPETITSAITKENPNLGKILAKTTQTQYPTGVEIPVMDITSSKARWVSENGKTDKEKSGYGTVSFKAHKLQQIFAMSKEVQVMSIDEFESLVAKKVVAGAIEAEEEAIFVGTGTGQMKGITVDTGTVSAEYEPTYASLLGIVGKLDDAYNGEFYMKKETFFNDVLSLTDDAGQPIARVNAGLGAGLEYTLLGRPVNTCKYVPKDTIIFGDMSKYCVNTVWSNKLSTHEDFDTDAHEMKGVSIVDGKPVLPEAFVVAIKKKTTPSHSS